MLNIGTDEEATQEIKLINVDPRSIPILVSKIRNFVIKIEGLKAPACNILKQEALGIGTDCAIPRNAIIGGKEPMNALLFGNLTQLKLLANKLKEQSFNLQEVGEKIKTIIKQGAQPRDTINLPHHNLDLSHSLICGILNVTPDSFYDGGKWIEPTQAIDRANKLVEEGADLIDIGGESTRPGAKPLSLKEELDRVMPVIEKLSVSRRISIPISIDTYKSRVAREALEAGCEIVNDTSGLRWDRKMPETIAKYSAGCVIMHIKGKPKTMQDEQTLKGSATGSNLIKEIIQFFKKGIEIAKNGGVNEDSILIDPGIGFGKRNPDDNLFILHKLKEFKVLGKPIFIGVSRKSFIGKVGSYSNTPLPLEERLEGSLAASVVAIMNGANIIRTHDVLATKRAVKIVDAILSVN